MATYKTVFLAAGDSDAIRDGIGPCRPQVYQILKTSRQLHVERNVANRTPDAVVIECAMARIYEEQLESC